MDASIAHNGCPTSVAGIRRGPVTWYCYLALGFFTYLLNIQGNILPFLKAELDLSYRAVSLHSSALAAGLIVVGLFGDRVIRRYGRRRALRLGTAGISAGAVLLCLAPAAWASIGSCALMGVLGGLIPAMVPAVLAETHGEDGRDVAYAEATAICYAFGILGPLTTGLFVAHSLGWRGVVLLGAAFGALILIGFRRTAVPDPAAAAAPGGPGLPAAYWAYWALIATVVAIEFCVLIWAPEFLERAAGLPRAWAAGSAAAFSLAMLLGRVAASRIVRQVAPRRLFLAALLVASVGFLVYWAIGQPLAIVAGLFVIGLGVAPLYPLALGFAITAAGAQGGTASARVMLAVGLALLLTPALLGGLADEVGLRLAHLMLPALVAAALLCLAAARVLERRTDGRPGRRGA
ncbi:MAG: sugar MFS transporter [Geminicoccaceae bacterium]